MLRTSLRSARLLGGKPIAAAAGRQWPNATSRQAAVFGQRLYATGKKPDATQPVIPPSETRSSDRPGSLDGSSKLAVDPKIVPLTPPKPPTDETTMPATEDDVGQSRLSGDKIHPLSGGKPEPPSTMDDVGESSVNQPMIDPLSGGKPKPTNTIDDVGESMVHQTTATPPTPPPPPPPKKKSFTRRLRNFLIALILLDAAVFAGGVWYSRINDNFHDFFTEYVPYGERAIHYIEELEYRKRFPGSPQQSSKYRQGDQVRVSSNSGASWRVADSSENSQRQSSASPSKPKAAEAKPAPKEEPKPKPAPASTKASDAATVVADKVKEQTDKAAKPAAASKPAAAPKDFKAPEVDEPSKFPPLEPIDLMKLEDAKEPLVRDLVHMVNDLILVINADGAHAKYGGTINKAKNDVKKAGSKLKEMKGRVEKKAAQEVRTRIEEFDKAATVLIERVEKAMVAQETQWRQEFETEMKEVRESYDGRVKLLMEREKKVNEQKLQNQLMEQALALRKEFVKDVTDRVEEERESRLGKLKDLSKSVSQLEELTVGWNDVVDSNLKTQQLHVAVDAVRATLEQAQHPRPFIKELVALKEIASDDPIVDAAIASVNPTAYQRGLPSTSQLIDRFRRVAGEVRKASLLPADAGVASHASSWVLSHVMFKKQGLAEGGDVESILTRAQTFLEEGDLDNAAREVNGLDGWAKTLSKDWLGEVRKVLEVQQALEVISTQARLQSLRMD